MGRIRSLELLFGLEQTRIKSKQDCIIAALHCLLLNEGLRCVGIGDLFSENDSESSSEMLPKQWNENQEVYSLRYVTKDSKHHYLMKSAKTGNALHVNVAVDEKNTAMMSVYIDKHVSDDYSAYSTAYRDLDSLSDAFRRDILGKLQENTSKSSNLAKSSSSQKKSPHREGPVPPPPVRSPTTSMLREERQPPIFPSVGGMDLDPFGRGQGGMFADPSSFGIPSRPTLPQFGVGGPGGLPRGAVPPGARFDPFGPPIGRPNPDHFRPPDYDDII